MSTEYVNCPVCGGCDMRKEPDGEEGFIITCTNLACASNGGDNASEILRGPYKQIESLQSRIRELKSEIREMHEYIQEIT